MMGKNNNECVECGQVVTDGIKLCVNCGAKGIVDVKKQREKTMKKTGRVRDYKLWRGVRVAKCANCGGKGIYRVTYEDIYSKLTVTLCEECEKLEYGQLKLQSYFDWSGQD